MTEIPRYYKDVTPLRVEMSQESYRATLVFIGVSCFCGDAATHECVYSYRWLGKVSTGNIPRCERHARSWAHKKGLSFVSENADA